VPTEVEIINLLSCDPGLVGHTANQIVRERRLGAVHSYFSETPASVTDPIFMRTGRLLFAVAPFKAQFSKDGLEVRATNRRVLAAHSANSRLFDGLFPGSLFGLCFCVMWLRWRFQHTSQYLVELRWAILSHQVDPSKRLENQVLAQGQYPVDKCGTDGVGAPVGPPLYQANLR
jgi:hypothetical protein